MNVDQIVDDREFLGEVLAGDDPKTTSEKYNKWSKRYEKAMAEVKYFGPTQLMEYFDQLDLPKGAKVLDICAGTGGIGRELTKRGYTDNHAIDGAEEMLAQAKAEQNYKSYTKFLFESGSKLPYEDGEFDCVLMAGVFAPAHLPFEALHEVCRVTKVGGKVAWICCDPKYYEIQAAHKQYANNSFYKVIDAITEEGIWSKRAGFPVEVPFIEYSHGYVMAFDIIRK